MPDLKDVFQQLVAAQMNSSQLSDLCIGTVTAAPPELEISIDAQMAPLKKSVLYLTAPVVEYKIPLLRHRHKIPHTHTVPTGQSGPPLPDEYSKYSLLSEGSSGDVQSGDVVCWINGQKVEPPVQDGFIILNPALKEGEKVLLMRVQHGSKFIVLSRVYEGS